MPGMNLLFLPEPMWNQSSWMDSWLKWYQHKTATSVSGKKKTMINGRHLFSLVLTDIEWICLFRFNAVNELLTSFSSLSILCDPSSLWKLEPVEVPLTTLKDTVAAAITWAVSAQLSLVRSMLVPPTIPLLVLESLFTVCSNAMSGETELNDDSEDDAETAWALFSVNSQCTVGATSCSILIPLSKLFPI